MSQSDRQAPTERVSSLCSYYIGLLPEDALILKHLGDNFETTKKFAGFYPEGPFVAASVRAESERRS
jgi:hypothetical protein